MAKRVRVIEILIDDFDGRELPEGSGRTFQFNWQGVDYELDASDEHAEQLEAIMQPVVSVARRVGGRKATTSKRSHRAVTAAPQQPQEQPALPAAPTMPEETPARVDPRSRPRRGRKEMQTIREFAWSKGYSKEQVPEYGQGGVPDWAVYVYEQEFPEKATRDWGDIKSRRRTQAPEPDAK